MLEEKKEGGGSIGYKWEISWQRHWISLIYFMLYDHINPSGFKKELIIIHIYNMNLNHMNRRLTIKIIYIISFLFVKITSFILFLNFNTSDKFIISNNMKKQNMAITFHTPVSDSSIADKISSKNAFLCSSLH